MLNLPDFLTRDDFGEVRLQGHRIGLYHVVLLAREGAPAERIVAEFPSLELGLVRRVLDFYQAHRAGVDAYVDACQAEIDRQRAAYNGPNLEDLRNRARLRPAEKP